MSESALNGVMDTLFIPLMSRKYISQEFPEYFYDKKCIEIVNTLPHNHILQKSSQYNTLSSASRCVVMDDIVSKFIEHYLLSNIVSIGCGFETMAYRLSNYKNRAHFYEVDFECVIKEREKILPQLDNETFIGGNINDINLSAYINTTLPTIFVVAGVFEYFNKSEVIELIHTLQHQFKGSEMIFDTTSSCGLKIANRYVKKTGNHNAKMYFSIDNGENFAKQSGTKLIKQKSMHCKVTKQLKRKLNLYTKISMSVSDMFNMAMIFHLSL